LCDTQKKKIVQIRERKYNKCKTSLPPIPAVIDSAATGIFLQSSSSITNYLPYPSTDPSRRISIGNGDIILAAGHGQLGKTSIPADHVPNISMNLVGLSSVLKDRKVAVCDSERIQILNGTAQIKNEINNLISQSINSNDLILTATQSNGLYMTDLNELLANSLTHSSHDFLPLYSSHEETSPSSHALSMVTVNTTKLQSVSIH
jgi:hypothetical protein